MQYVTLPITLSDLQRVTTVSQTMLTELRIWGLHGERGAQAYNGILQTVHQATVVKMERTLVNVLPFLLSLLHTLLVTVSVCYIKQHVYQSAEKLGLRPMSDTRHSPANRHYPKSVA